MVVDMLHPNPDPFNSGLIEQRICRLLYYGPAGAGKRENLREIYRAVPPEQRLSFASDDPERQIAFRVNQDDGDQWQVLVQAVDSGRERLHAAGMSARPPFDGIVFLVSSSSVALEQGLDALESLKTYLESWSLDLVTVPVVIQYNGRDAADASSVDQLESLLNPWGLLSYPAVAKLGEGVRETLKAVLGLTVNHLGEAADPSVTEETEIPSVSDGGLGIDYGPPVPESGPCDSTRALSQAIYAELRPPVVIPVNIPRRLLEGQEPLRILLEVTIDEDEY